MNSRLGYHLTSAHLTARKRFLEATNEWDITPAQYAILCLIEANTFVTQADLCSTMNILRPNMVTLMSPLETKDLIKRSEFAHDRRNMLLSLTVKGKKLRKKIEGLLEVLEAELMEDFSEEEKRTFFALLERFHASNHAV
ncbi:MarR family winged helix-turn-helix transcriptional regulator [Paraburkholderia sediminicola]|uniref:MarR family winged helix-turn-helix transcriptional regulator n=1 Tax=Paraburkholderia sediminicola TaxID=458836 RepID=UPI0038B9A338